VGAIAIMTTALFAGHAGVRYISACFVGVLDDGKGGKSVLVTVVAVIV